MDTLIADCFVFHMFGIFLGALMSKTPLTWKRCIWFVVTGTYYWWKAVILGAKTFYDEVKVAPQR